MLGFRKKKTPAPGKENRDQNSDSSEYRDADYKHAYAQVQALNADNLLEVISSGSFADTALLQQLTSEFSTENYHFIIACKQALAIESDEGYREAVNALMRQFVGKDAPTQVNLAFTNLKPLLLATTPADYTKATTRAALEACLHEIVVMITKDSIPRLKKNDGLKEMHKAFWKPSDENIKGMQIQRANDEIFKLINTSFNAVMKKLDTTKKMSKDDRSRREHKLHTLTLLLSEYRAQVTENPKRLFNLDAAIERLQPTIPAGQHGSASLSATWESNGKVTAGLRTKTLIKLNADITEALSSFKKESSAKVLQVKSSSRSRMK